MKGEEGLGGDGKGEGALGGLSRFRSPEKLGLSELKGCPEASGPKVETRSLTEAGMCVLFGSQGIFDKFESVANI